MTKGAKLGREGGWEEGIPYDWVRKGLLLINRGKIKQGNFVMEGLTKERQITMGAKAGKGRVRMGGKR